MIRTYVLDALRITRIYKDEMQIEHARCLHLLADLSNFQPLRSDDYSVAYEARLAANKEILDHAHHQESGFTDIRRSALGTGLDRGEFDRTLGEKIFCVWR